MGGSYLQFLLTLILLLLCMKPTIANYLGLGDTHLGCKEHERQALLRLNKILLMTMAFFLLGALIKIVAHGVGSSVATKQATSSCSISMSRTFSQCLCEVNLILP